MKSSDMLRLRCHSTEEMPQLNLEGMTTCCPGSEGRHDPKVGVGGSPASCPVEGREYFGMERLFLSHPLQQGFMGTLAIVTW